MFSIPFAFLGGYLKINQVFFFILLGFTLLFASITIPLLRLIYKPSTILFVSNRTILTKVLAHKERALKEITVEYQVCFSVCKKYHNINVYLNSSL